MDPSCFCFFCFVFLQWANSWTHQMKKKPILLFILSISRPIMWKHVTFAQTTAIAMNKCLFPLLVVVFPHHFQAIWKYQYSFAKEHEHSLPSSGYSGHLFFFKWYIYQDDLSAKNLFKYFFNIWVLRVLSECIINIE